MRMACSLAALAAAFALGACFDPDSAKGSGTDSVGGTSTSSDPTCVDGSSGCPCYGNGTCDAGLECNPTVALCIPEDCNPGSESCTCNDGVCLAGLSCEAGVCVVPAPTTDPVTTDPATSDPVTTDPVTTDPVTTDSLTDSAEITSDPATTDPVTTDSAEATTDPTGATCEGECPTCMLCQVVDPGVCAGVYADCGGDPECASLFECCAGDPTNCPTCCVDYADEVQSRFLDVAICLSDNAACPGCPDLLCF